MKIRWLPPAMYPNRIILAAFAVFVTTAPASGIAEVLDVANSIRLKGCGNLSAADQPLQRRANLDEAARRIARGDGLENAVSAAGYRGRKSASIHIRTRKGDDGVAQMLRNRFCDIVADSGLHEIGIFRRGSETWMVLATPFDPPSPGEADEIGRRVLQLINQARRQARSCGPRTFAATTPLNQVAALGLAALAHTKDMAMHGYLGHEGSDGSSPADRATRAGYAWVAVAENVAAGQTTAEEVVSTWIASPGHCENLMDPRYSDSGVAFAVDTSSDKGIYWAQVFGTTE